MVPDDEAPEEATTGSVDDPDEPTPEPAPGASAAGTGGPPRPDPVESAFDELAGRPRRTLGLVLAVLLALAYAVLIQQELLLVVWLLAVGFLVYLFWRLVRAHERLAGAAQRLAESGD